MFVFLLFFVHEWRNFVAETEFTVELLLLINKVYDSIWSLCSLFCVLFALVFVKDLSLVRIF